MDSSRSNRVRIYTTTLQLASVLASVPIFLRIIFHRVIMLMQEQEKKNLGRVEADDELGVKDCGQVFNVTEFECT